MPKIKSTPVQVGSHRFKIQALYQNPNAQFAIFMRSKSGSGARFSTVHDSMESALEMAREYAANAIRDGNLDFTFYVVEILHRVGIEGGKPIDKARDAP